MAQGEVSMKSYKTYHFKTYTELSIELDLPIHLNLWHKILDSIFVSFFAGQHKGEPSLKESFPEASGIIHYLSKNGGVTTAVIIFVEDMKED